MSCRNCNGVIHRSGGFRGEAQFCDSACAMIFHQEIDCEQATKLQEAMDERVEPPVPKRWKHLRRVR